MVSRLRLGVADLVLDLAGLAEGGGGGLAVSVGIAAVVAVVVLGPLVVVSLDLAGVLLVVVGFGGDGVVGLAPSAVEVAAIGLLGPLVVIVAGTGGGVVAGGLGIAVASVSLLGGGSLSSLRGTVGFSISVFAVTNWVDGSVFGGGGGGGSSVGSSVHVVVTSGSGLTEGRGTVDIAVLAPSLGSPFVVILVVPFVIRLGIVGLGPGAVVRFLDGEILVAAIGIPVGAGLAPVASLASLGGGIVLSALLGGHGGAVVAGVSVALDELVGVLAPLGGTTSLSTSISGVISVIILSPLVVIGLDGSGVALVVVRLGRDGIVRLAPSGVVVGAVSLLGPLVVVVSTSGGLLGGGSSLPDHAVAALAGSGTVVTGMSTVLGDIAALAVVVGVVGLSVLGDLLAVELGSTVALLGSILGGGNGTVGGSAIDISVLAPGLSAPLVIISVVPLIVRLSGVGLSSGAVVAHVLRVVLIAAPGVPVGTGLAPVVLAVGLGGGSAVTTLAVAGALAP